MKNLNDIWYLLDKQFSKYPQDVVGSASPKEITQGEKDLGVKFNDEYKKFLSKYGGACIGSKLIYGLRKHKDMSDDHSNVIKLTNFYRNQNWPNTDKWYIVSDDFDGNPIGIDPEGKVWLSDHDSGFELVKLADSFEEFLYKLYTDTLYQ